MARLHALLRRAGADPATTVGTLRPGPRRPRASAAGTRERLADADRVPRCWPRWRRGRARSLRRLDLVRAAWPEGAIVHDNTLDQYVARLRRKLRELEADSAIATVHGVGYRLG